LPIPTLPASTLTTTTPWETVVGGYLDAAIDSPHTRRAYERHLRHAFAVLGVWTVRELTGADLARSCSFVLQPAIVSFAERLRHRYAWLAKVK
jgi:hypothetical protein